jgi:hypothetical protein
MKNKDIKMKKMTLAAVATMSLSAFAQTPTNEDLKKINARLEELETESYTRNFKLSGYMWNIYESYNESSKMADGTKNDDQNVNTIGTLIGINIDFNIHEQLKFYSTIGMSKYWQTDDRPGVAGNGSSSKDPESRHWEASEQGSYGFRSSVARFDRGYLQYTFKDPRFNLAIGRFPTNMGLPINQLDGLDRTGTYPRLAYNAIFDGIAATANLSSSLPTGQSFIARVFYTPNIFVADRQNNAQQNGQNQTPTSESNQVHSNQPLGAALLEYENRNLGFVKNFKLHQFTNYYTNFYSPAYGGDYLRSLGSSTFLGFEGIAGTGLNLSGSYLKTDTWEEKDKGRYFSDAFLWNANYNFTNGHVIGGEYMTTDKQFYLDEWTNIYTSDFYRAARMRGYHLFWSLPVVDNVRLRLGMFDYKTKADGSFETPKRDVQSFYAALRATF